VVCLHGWRATPFEVRRIAEACAERGIDAAGPLFPGHGFREVEAQRRGILTFSAQEALDTVRSEVSRCRALGYERVLLCGQSMGGALALAVAAETEVDALAVCAPAIELPFESALAEHLADSRDCVPIEDEETFENYSYRFDPLGGLLALDLIARAGREGIARIRCPVLVLQSHGDTTIPITVGDRIEREAGGSVERQFFDESGHSMGVDVCAEEVSQAVASFFCDRLDELTSG
jgi:carboxylesterase